MEEAPPKEEADTQDDLAAAPTEDEPGEGDFSEPHGGEPEEDDDDWTAADVPAKSSAASQTEPQDSEDRVEQFLATRASAPWSKTVLYRFLTNRKTDDGYMVDSDDEEQ